MEKKKVSIYIEADYSGSPKAGTGKYGYVLEYIDSEGRENTKEVFGGYSNTTKHRTFLHATIDALGHLKADPCEVYLLLDCPYVAESYRHRSMLDWQAAGWIKNGRDWKPVANSDLWEKTVDFVKTHEISAFRENDNKYRSWLQTMLRTGEIKIKTKTDREE